MLRHYLNANLVYPHQAVNQVEIHQHVVGVVVEQEGFLCAQTLVNHHHLHHHYQLVYHLYSEKYVSHSFAFV